MINRNYEILKVLYENDGFIDADLLINKLTIDLSENEKMDSTASIARAIISMQDADKCLIRKWDINTRGEFYMKYTDRGRFISSTFPISIQITSNGIDEYQKLDRIINPPPPIVPINITGDIIGSQIGSNYSSFENDKHSPITKTVTNAPNKKNTTGSLLERIYWIAGIFTFLLLFYAASKGCVHK